MIDRTIQTETELRYWLANEDWYMSRYTRNWLEQTLPDEAADLLARIAEDAQPAPHSLLHLLYTGFATIGFLPSAGGQNEVRKAGTRAALLLASHGDARCLPPLLRVFETQGLWQSKYQESIEFALTDYLSSPEHWTGAQQYTDAIRTLAERIWKSGGTQRELSRPLAQLLLTTLRFLQGIGDTASDTLLRMMAESRVEGANRRHLQEVARSLLPTTEGAPHPASRLPQRA